MVRCQSISSARGRFVRVARFRLPRTAWSSRVRQLALQLVHHLAHHLPRRVLRLLRDDVAQREQRRDQMHVRLDLLQHLRLQQHLRQVQPLQRVLLHHRTAGAGK